MLEHPRHLSVESLANDWGVVENMYRAGELGLCWYFAFIQGISILKESDPYFLTHYFFQKGMQELSCYKLFSKIGGLSVPYSKSHPFSLTTLLGDYFELDSIGISLAPLGAMKIHELPEILIDSKVYIMNTIYKSPHRSFGHTVAVAKTNGDYELFDPALSKSNVLHTEVVETLLRGDITTFKGGECDFTVEIFNDAPGFLLGHK